jgi:hypothetical protein
VAAGAWILATTLLPGPSSKIPAIKEKRKRKKKLFLELLKKETS